MKIADRIDNSVDIIDSRDIITRIDTLTGERDAFEGDWAEECSDDADELAALESLTEQAEGYCADWRYGATLIRDSHFEDYARDLAEDIGAIKDDASWPYTCIDWERAARELQMDYASVEFDGVTYWVR